MSLPISLLLPCAALSAITVALLIVLLVRRKRDAHDTVEASDRLAASIDRFDASVDRLDQQLHAADLLTTAALAPIQEELAKVRSGIAGYARGVENALAERTPKANDNADPVALEHQILGTSWEKFRANQELSAALDEALQDRAWTQLIDDLTNIVPVDLKPTFDAVIGPCREHRRLLQQMDLIPRVLNGTFPRCVTDAEEVWFTRKLAALLTYDAASRLEFRFKSWVTDSFLSFADLYLQRCQQAELERNDEALQTGADVVRQVLRIAAVEPIDVTPGETQFDSTRHVGRSTSNDPRFADGVITGVVRNGFIEGGQQVIRQPEVIVNRVR